VVAEFALNTVGAASTMLRLHPGQSLFQLTKSIFASLRWRAARDHAQDKGFLYR
jgi:hypothetical protein